MSPTPHEDRFACRTGDMQPPRAGAAHGVEEPAEGPLPASLKNHQSGHRSHGVNGVNGVILNSKIRASTQISGYTDDRENRGKGSQPPNRAEQPGHTGPIRPGGDR